MKGIVSSVKRRVFGKDGEEILTDGLSDPSDIAHISHTTPKETSLPTRRNSRGNSPVSPASSPSNNSLGKAPSIGENGHSRRDKLRSRSTNEIRKENRDRAGSKSKPLEESQLKNSETVIATSSVPKPSSTGKDAGSSAAVGERLRKGRKDWANNTASFTGRQYAVPIDYGSLQPGLLPGSAKDCNTQIFGSLKALRDVTNASERESLFRQKIQACGQVVFDLDHPSFVKEKDAKKATLIELVDYVANTRNSITDAIVPDMMQMIAVNIFRDLPATNDCSVLHHFQLDDEDAGTDPQWSHRQTVYEFFMRFILASEIEVKVMRQYINQSFIIRLLDLFQTEDQREREFLKSLLHRIYGKVMSLRQFIRRSIQNVFHRFIEGHGRPYGIAELLEILGSIINGFATPLKAEHKVMLEKSFIPLHKSWAYSIFQNQLQYCMVQYVLKDPSLGETIIMGILRYWPASNTQKELSFVNEIEEIMAEIQSQRPEFHPNSGQGMAEFERIKVPLFSRFAQCIQSSHFQVAERVLFLWHPNCIISPVVEEYKEDAYPLLMCSLRANEQNHWNGVVHQLTYQVSKLMTDWDEDLSQRYKADISAKAEENEQMETMREDYWKMLEDAYSEPKVNKTAK